MRRRPKRLLRSTPVSQMTVVPIAQELEMDWKITDSAVKKRVVVLVSKQEHCLYDLLARWQSKELNVEIPCVISNHDTFRGFVEWHGIPFHHVPVTPDNKPNYRIPALLKAANGDLLICDIGNHVVRKLDPRTGLIATFAGTDPRGPSAGRSSRASAGRCAG